MLSLVTSYGLKNAFDCLLKYLCSSPSKRWKTMNSKPRDCCVHHLINHAQARVAYITVADEIFTTCSPAFENHLTHLPGNSIRKSRTLSTLRSPVTVSPYVEATSTCSSFRVKYWSGQKDWFHSFVRFALSLALQQLRTLCANPTCTTVSAVAKTRVHFLILLLVTDE